MRIQRCLHVANITDNTQTNLSEMYSLLAELELSF
jgi:hypothetical protein